MDKKLTKKCLSLQRNPPSVPVEKQTLGFSFNTEPAFNVRLFLSFNLHIYRYNFVA